MVKMRPAFLISLLLTATVAYARAPRLVQDTDAPPGDGYQFNVKGKPYSIKVLGRKVTTTGQLIYVQLIYKDESVEDAAGVKMRDETVNDLLRGKQFLLEDEEGASHEPINAHVAEPYVRGLRFLDGVGGPVMELKYRGAFSGELRLVVKLGAGHEVRLPFGPAGRNDYRTGTVTKAEGLQLRAGPNSWYPVIKTLGPGETFHVTGICESNQDDIIVSEAICGDVEGWLEKGPETGGEDYFEVGAFAPQ